jgi:hypothetical protein
MLPIGSVIARLPGGGAQAAHNGGVSALYRDRWIMCTDDALLIRGYYFPWGTKRIPYRSIRQIRRVRLGTFTGWGRIWGSTTLRYWASLDPDRPTKHTGLVLDTGRHIQPFITPDDPAAVEAAILGHSAAEAVNGGSVVV